MYNETYIWNWLKSNTELSDCAVAAIMGNIEAESAGLPNNLENRANVALNMSDEEYTTAVDNGTWTREDFAKDRGAYGGYGLCQWTYFSRKYALWDFAKAKGVSIADIDMQLEFMLKELQTSYKTVWNSLMTASNIMAPCSRFLHLYENPANATAQESKRYDMASAIYDRNHKEESNLAQSVDNTELINSLLDISNVLNTIVNDLKEIIEKL